MKKIFDSLLSSFDNETKGFSGRKLTAFWLVIVVTWLHYNYVDKSIVVDVIQTDLVFIAVCLGLVTVQQIVDFKNGKRNEQ